jgi:hypothetical protein
LAEDIFLVFFCFLCSWRTWRCTNRSFRIITVIRHEYIYIRICSPVTILPMKVARLDKSKEKHAK